MKLKLAIGEHNEHVYLAMLDQDNNDAMMSFTVIEKSDIPALIAVLNRYAKEPETRDASTLPY